MEPFFSIYYPVLVELYVRVCIISAQEIFIILDQMKSETGEGER